jgi:hypothetical protein
MSANARARAHTHTHTYTQLDDGLPSSPAKFACRPHARDELPTRSLSHALRCVASAECVRVRQAVAQQPDFSLVKFIPTNEAARTTRLPAEFTRERVYERESLREREFTRERVYQRESLRERAFTSLPAILTYSPSPHMVRAQAREFGAWSRQCQPGSPGDLGFAYALAYTTVGGGGGSHDVCCCYVLSKCRKTTCTLPQCRRKLWRASMPLHLPSLLLISFLLLLLLLLLLVLANRPPHFFSLFVSFVTC